MSRKWQDAIAEHTKERVSSKMGHLVKVIWKQVFKPMWNQRNAILHMEGSVARVKENELLEAKLLRFKQTIVTCCIILNTIWWNKLMIKLNIGG